MNHNQPTNNPLHQGLLSDDVSNSNPYEITNEENQDNNQENQDNNQEKEQEKELEKEQEKEQEEIQKFKKPRIRCHQCNKKLSMMSFKCKCGNMYCIAHQIPHNHICSYNHKQEKIIQIQNNTPKINSKFTPL